MVWLWKNRNERSAPLISVPAETPPRIEIPAQKIELGLCQARSSIPKSSFTGGTKNLRERRNLDLHSYDAAAHHELCNVGPANDHHSDDSIPGEPVFDIKRDEPGARRNGGYALLFRPAPAGSVELVCLVDQFQFKISGRYK
jgi:hypothetical protein